MSDKGNIDETLRVAQMYQNYPDLLKEHVEARNLMADELNEKVMKIVEVSPISRVIDKDGNITEVFDVATKELLKQISDENDYLLRKSFPDLYKLNDHEEKN